MCILHNHLRLLMLSSSSPPYRCHIVFLLRSFCNDKLPLQCFPPHLKLNHKYRHPMSQGDHNHMAYMRMDFEYLHLDLDRKMGCTVRNVDLVYCVDSCHIHHRLFFLNVHKLLDRNGNLLRDYCSYIL